MSDRGARRIFSIGQGGDLAVSYPGYSNKRQFATDRVRQLEALVTILSVDAASEVSYMPEGFRTDLLYLAAELAGEVCDALDGANSNDGSNA